MKIQRFNNEFGLYPLALVVFCTTLVGWVRPDVPTKTKPSVTYADQLQLVTIEVNGAIQSVKNGESLKVVRGDKIKILSGILNNPTNKIDELNVIGFDSPKSRKGDDRNIEFKTTALQERWSENRDGLNFVVIATSGKSTHGYVFLSLIEPVLKFAVLDLNGREVVLRDGEPFVASGSDKVRVKRVATNVSDNDNVFVQVIPVKGRPGEYEMRFLREKMIFARLPMKLEK